MRSIQYHWRDVSLLHANRDSSDFGAYRPCNKASGTRSKHKFTVCDFAQGGKCSGRPLDCTNTSALLELSIVATFDFLSCNTDRWHHPHGCLSCTCDQRMIH